jgi:hypothetical protein
MALSLNFSDDEITFKIKTENGKLSFIAEVADIGYCVKQIAKILEAILMYTSYSYKINDITIIVENDKLTISRSGDYKCELIYDAQLVCKAFHILLLDLVLSPDFFIKKMFNLCVKSSDPRHTSIYLLHHVHKLSLLSE